MTLRLVGGSAEDNERTGSRIDQVIADLMASLMTPEQALREAYMLGWNDRRELFEAITRCANCDKILDSTVPDRERCSGGGRHVARVKS